MALKILVAGDAEGNLAGLFKKVGAVNSKVSVNEIIPDSWTLSYTVI